MCVRFEFSFLKSGCHLARLQNDDRYVRAESFNSSKFWEGCFSCIITSVWSWLGWSWFSIAAFVLLLNYKFIWFHHNHFTVALNHVHLTYANSAIYVCWKIISLFFFMQHSLKYKPDPFLLGFNQRNSNLFQHYRKSQQHWALWRECSTRKTTCAVRCGLFKLFSRLILS